MEKLWVCMKLSIIRFCRVTISSKAASLPTFPTSEMIGLEVALLVNELPTNQLSSQLKSKRFLEVAPNDVLFQMIYLIQR